MMKDDVKECLLEAYCADSFEKVVEHYKKALELDSDHSYAHYTLASLYGKRKISDAISELQEALRLDKDNVYANEMLEELMEIKAAKEIQERTIIKKITFSDIGGLDEVKNEIKLAIIYPMLRPDLYRLYRSEGGNSILLYGPPGCGKTYLAKAVAGEVNANFFNIKITDLLSKWHGATDKNVQNVFHDAQKMAPSVLFFDEIDGISGVKGATEEQFERRILNVFLTEMDGFEDKGDVMVLAATNTPWNVDPALLRPGRFGKLVFVPPPDFEARKAIFKIHLRDRPLSEDLDLTKLSELTEWYSGADIKGICDEASLLPLKEALDGGEPRNILMEDFVKTIEKRKSSLIHWFGIAKKQLMLSGGSEIFKELFAFAETMSAGEEPVGYL